MPHVDLLELPYFQGLSMNDLVALVDLMQPATYEPGALLMAEGDTEPQPLFIATSGQVRISKCAPGNGPRELAQLKSPTLFGEIELFCDIPPVCSAQAMTRVAAFKLTRSTFDRLFAARNSALMQFTFNVARVACHRLAVADELLAQSLPDKDLTQMRQAVFTRMAAGHKLTNTTGAFRLPPGFGKNL